MSFRRWGICLLLAVLPLASSRLIADELPSWTAIGPDGGVAGALAVSPALPDWIFAGLQQGYGIFRSTDRGRSWGAAADTFGRFVVDLSIDADGKAFYAAADDALLKSTDGGALWPALDARRGYTLVRAHPRKAAIVFAVRKGHLLRSTNGGVTRTIVQGPQGVAAVAFAVMDRRTVAYAGGSNGFWRSTDDGRSWTSSNPDLPFTPHVESIAVDASDPGVVYIGLLRQSPKGLFKSTDGGITWRLSQRGLQVNGQVPPVLDLAVDRTDPSIVYANVEGELFRSVNGGRDWSRPGPRLPGLSITDLETTGYGVLAATLAGVFLSADHGLTWSLRTHQMVATSITGLAIDNQAPARLYAGDALVGVFKTTSRGRPWLRLKDIQESYDWYRPLQVDPTDSSVVYAGVNDGIAKSVDGGRHWTVHSGLSCLAPFRIALDPREPSRLYAAGLLHCLLGLNSCVFYRSLDAGETWQCIGIAAQFSGVAPLAIDPFTSAVYAQDLSGNLLRSTDQGATWTLVRERLFASSFAASPLVEGTLWAGKLSAVERSRDGGATWRSFGTGLPAPELVVGLAPDPVDPAMIYAATELSGVFKSTDAGETWRLAGIWSPYALYQGGLLVDPRDPTIVYAGTDSLGVLRLDQRGN